MQAFHTGVAHPWLCDIMGHMTTRHYIAMFDDASYLFLYRTFGWAGDDAAAGLGWADVRHEIDYQAEVAAGDLLEIHGAIERVGNKSITVRYEMHNMKKNEVAATLVSTSVLFDLKARKAVTLNDEMRQAATDAIPGKD